MTDAEREFMYAGLRASRSSPRAAALVLLSGASFAALFLVSWAIFMPVGALVVAPLTLGISLLLGAPPSLFLNSAAAIALSGCLAAATVVATLRVLLRRARSRHGELAAQPGGQSKVFKASTGGSA